ncbi:unnamed protein product [Angiostrongylus costaricensis]|uniref:LITAF domain-containing protein n=1 Tax=Angiostrongylus costaricensis TaxID=334426 RepID=A0A0R3PW18_ANGCS|nr:unnamed protein product [Angiostrongylus costaricensis]
MAYFSCCQMARTIYKTPSCDACTAQTSTSLSRINQQQGYVTRRHVSHRVFDAESQQVTVYINCDHHCNASFTTPPMLSVLLFCFLLSFHVCYTRVITAYGKTNMMEYGDELITPSMIVHKEEAQVTYEQGIPEEQPPATVDQTSVPHAKVEASGYH